MTPGQIDRQAMCIPTPRHTTTASTDLHEFTAALKRALRRLRPEYRRCFTLRHMERRSYDEIAEIVHLPPGTVKSHVHRAKQELRRMLRRVRPAASEDPVRRA